MSVNFLHGCESLCLTLLLWVSIFTIPIEAVVPCNSTHNPCEEVLWAGSQCRNGFCTNPFQSGCLASLLNDDQYQKKYSDSADDIDGSLLLAQTLRRLRSNLRVCNSDDAPGDAENGLCAINEKEYSEVRIWTQNWESAIALSWIFQIIYSELLGVPASIETGRAGVNMNFYDETNAMQYGAANEYEMFQNAYDAEGGDCTVYNTEENRNAGEAYMPCAHIVPEVWFPNSHLAEQIKDGVAEPIAFSGAVGYQGWYITQFTTEEEPSLGTYFGMRGQMNRRKLAETFKRPTSWRDYCDLVSVDNCTTSDDVAKRAPAADGSENERYFDASSFTGYFRATDKNNCNKTEACTGHFMDYPCGWSSFFKAQSRHLDIALESDGKEDSGGGEYTYPQVVEIWSAANATKSNLIGMWWQPEAVQISFFGSYLEMVPVTLPATTQECVDARVDITKRCDDEATEFQLYGDAVGACGESGIGLKKLTVGNMLSNIKENKNKRAQMSPAYDMYKNFFVTELQINQILVEWINRGQVKSNFDLRFATCKWVADNLELIHTFLPKSHPRGFVDVPMRTRITYAAISVSAIAIFITVIIICGVIRKQQKGEDANKISQIEFVILLLAGLLLVSIGSLLMVLNPSKATCISSVWMINVGYTLELVPLIVKVNAIVQILQASKKMRRIIVDKKQLLAKSLGLSAIAAMYCTLWAIFDPPQEHSDLKLTDEINDLGETVVAKGSFCDSESSIWYYISFIWQSLLLIYATVLAYQMRSAPKGVDDSLELGIMIYSSSLFLILRIVMYVMAGSSTKSEFDKTGSLFCSLDTIVNILIYFPKLFRKTIPKAKAPTLSQRTSSMERWGIQPCHVDPSHVDRTSKSSKEAVPSYTSGEEEKTEDVAPDFPVVMRPFQGYCEHCRCENCRQIEVAV